VYISPDTAGASDPSQLGPEALRAGIIRLVNGDLCSLLCPRYIRPRGQASGRGISTGGKRAESSAAGCSMRNQPPRQEDARETENSSSQQRGHLPSASSTVQKKKSPRGRPQRAGAHVPPRGLDCWRASSHPQPASHPTRAAPRRRGAGPLPRPGRPTGCGPGAGASTAPPPSTAPLGARPPRRRPPGADLAAMAPPPSRRPRAAAAGASGLSPARGPPPPPGDARRARPCTACIPRRRHA